MRFHGKNDLLTVRVIAGTQTVLFAMNLKQEAREGLLGFAIGRLRSDGKADWLRGRKVFESVVPSPDPHDDFPCSDHPIQSFIWSDFLAKPGAKFSYLVAPVYGPPSKPQLGQGVQIDGACEDPTSGTHGIYFNRGVIASQAYFESDQNKPPKDQDDPADPTVRRLSRGMLDAALAFIAAAQPGDRLLVAAYEFNYKPFMLALKSAAAAGVTVDIVYEAGQEKRKDGTVKDTSATTSARAAIDAHGLDRQDGLSLIKRTKRRSIPHNKFVVLVRDGKAIEVMTGSVNFTPSGFFGQSNVLHIVRDAKVADQYFEYWKALSADPPTTDLSGWNKKRIKESELDGLTKDPGIVAFFSPRKNDDMLDWYASQLAGASQTAMFTAAFGVNKTLAAEFAIDRPFVRFVLLEDVPTKTLEKAFAQDPDVWYAYGSLLGAFSSGKAEFPHSSIEKWFLKEELFRKQGSIFFIHTKFLLIDPLSDNPLVCTGSANFSSASLTGNDENMLLIRGDTSVADIYLTEFDRIFRHFFARQEINRRILGGEEIQGAKFLDETDGWVQDYVLLGRKKMARQQIFFEEWPE